MLNACSKKIIERKSIKDKKTLNLKDQSFVTSDKSVIAYSDNGLINKPTILFIHGYLSSREGLFPLAKKINDTNYRLILVDVPGFGTSSKNPMANYKITEQAKRVNELIKYLNLTSVNLIGTSMGGAIAIALNGMNPDIKSNTLIAPLGMPLYTGELPGIFDYFIEKGKLAFIVDKEYDKRKTNRLLKNVTNIPSFLVPRFVKKYMEEKLVAGREATNKVGFDILYDTESVKNLVRKNPRFASKIDSTELNKKEYSNQKLTSLLNSVNQSKSVKSIDPIGNKYEDLTPYLKQIQNPVLVYWGNKDNIIHYKTIESMRPYLKNAKYTVFKNGAHAISFTKDKQIAQELKQLINQN